MSNSYPCYVGDGVYYEGLVTSESQAPSPLPLVPEPCTPLPASQTPQGRKKRAASRKAKPAAPPTDEVLTPSLNCFWCSCPAHTIRHRPKSTASNQTVTIQCRCDCSGHSIRPCFACTKCHSLAQNGLLCVCQIPKVDPAATSCPRCLLPYCTCNRCQCHCGDFAPEAHEFWLDSERVSYNRPLPESALTQVQAPNAIIPEPILPAVHNPVTIITGASNTTTPSAAAPQAPPATIAVVPPSAKKLRVESPVVPVPGDALQAVTELCQAMSDSSEERNRFVFTFFQQVVTSYQSNVKIFQGEPKKVLKNFTKFVDWQLPGLAQKITKHPASNPPPTSNS
ncbi:hypothetical protein Pelo_14888 [Pelomyxa schiedti]|nr:hypothetical protein Pelo_14888 [Pelomyxa schiedti]